MEDVRDIRKLSLNRAATELPEALIDVAHRERVLTPEYLTHVLSQVDLVGKLLNKFEWERDPRIKHNLFRSVEVVINLLRFDILNRPLSENDKYLYCYLLSDDFLGYYPFSSVIKAPNYKTCTMSIDALAGIFDVSKSTMHEWVKKGKVLEDNNLEAERAAASVGSG